MSLPFPARVETSAVVDDGQLATLTVDAAFDPDTPRRRVQRGVAHRFLEDRSEIGGDDGTWRPPLVDVDYHRGTVGVDCCSDPVGLLDDAFCRFLPEVGRSGSDSLHHVGHAFSQVLELPGRLGAG